MFFVYKITLIAMGLSYVGMSKNPRRRLIQHRCAHPDWFKKGGRIEILSSHKTLSSALRAEARSILSFNTLAPHGLNMLKAGAIGLLRNRLTPKDLQALAPKMSQMAKDAVAMGRLATQPKFAACRRTEQARRRTAWKRKDAGLPPIPGTEHLLRGGRQTPRPGHSEAAKMKMRQSRQKWLVNNPQGSAARQSMSNWLGKKRTEADKEKRVAAITKYAITNGPMLTWPMVLRKAQRAEKRAAKGKQPVPGTEIFLGIRQPKGRADADWIANGRKYREQTVKRVNAWLRQYGIDQGWIKI